MLDLSFYFYIRYRKLQLVESLETKVHTPPSHVKETNLPLTLVPLEDPICGFHYPLTFFYSLSTNKTPLTH